MNYSSALICERWRMPLGSPGRKDHQWFLNWVLRKPEEASAHITACCHAAMALRQHFTDPVPFASVTEYFGGMGCQALIIQNLFRPPVHTVNDLHPLAVQHLHTALARYPSITVTRRNAYDMTPTGELAVLDCGDMTIHQATGRLYGWLERTFAAAPKAVVLTDIAGARLHLQRERYEADMGAPCGDYPQYLAGLGNWLGKEFGYYLDHCFHRRWSAVMTLLPGAGAGVIRTTPQQPKGIQLCP